MASLSSKSRKTSSSNPRRMGRRTKRSRTPKPRRPLPVLRISLILPLRKPREIKKRRFLERGKEKRSRSLGNKKTPNSQMLLKRKRPKSLNQS